MTKKLFSAAIASIIMAASSQAADKLIIKNADLLPGQTADVEVYASLDAGFTNKAIQGYFYLPEGFSFASTSGEVADDFSNPFNVIQTMASGTYTGSMKVNLIGLTLDEGETYLGKFSVTASEDALSGSITVKDAKIAGVWVNNRETYTEDINSCVKINANGYATFCWDENVEVNASVLFASLSGDYLVLSGEGSVVPANTGVILKGEGNSLVAIKATDKTSSEQSCLTPAVEDVTVVANSVLTLSTTDEAFYTFNGTEIPAHKAYLELNSSAGSRIRMVENTTGIKNINAEDITLNYNLMGQPIKTQKGIIIENGVKTIKF